jgi:uncharacterized membrane protein
VDIQASGDQTGGEAPARSTMGPGWTDTGRLETFSDGVIAIAITLLILEVKVPNVAGHELGAVLRHEWPSFAAYVVSFLTIGVMWVNHHHMFRLIERSNHTFLILNVLFLMTIAFLPWPTVLVGTYIHDPDGRIVAAVAYGATMVAIAIMFNVVWAYAASKGGRLLAPEVDRATLPRVSRSYLVGPIVYGTATLLALVDPYISLAIYAALGVFWLLPRSGTRQAVTLS